MIAGCATQTVTRQFHTRRDTEKHLITEAIHAASSSAFSEPHRANWGHNQQNYPPS